MGCSHEQISQFLSFSKTCITPKSIYVPILLLYMVPDFIAGKKKSIDRSADLGKVT